MRGGCERGSEVYKVDTVNFAILQAFLHCFIGLRTETEVDTMRGVHLPERGFGPPLSGADNAKEPRRANHIRCK